MKELFHQITTASYEFHPDQWSSVSNDAKEFIQALLVVDPNERLSGMFVCSLVVWAFDSFVFFPFSPTAGAALGHKWMSQAFNEQAARLKVEIAMVNTLKKDEAQQKEFDKVFRGVFYVIFSFVQF